MRKRKIKDGFKMEHKISINNYNNNEFNIVLTEIGFFSDAKNHYIEREGGFSTNEKIIFFCVGGIGYIETDIKIQIKKGNIFILPKGKKHKYYSSEKSPWSIYWAHFKEEKEKKIETNKKYKIINSEKEILLKILFQNIIENLEWNFNLKNIEFSRKSFEYLIECVNHYTGSSLDKTINEENTITEGTLLISYIEENIDKKITRKNLCDVLNCSNSHLNIIFNEEFNMSPMKYVNYKKIIFAEMLLKTTILSIADISRKIGIENPLYFSKMFKNKTKRSPKEYRKNNKK